MICPKCNERETAHTLCVPCQETVMDAMTSEAETTEELWLGHWMPGEATWLCGCLLGAGRRKQVPADAEGCDTCTFTRPPSEEVPADPWLTSALPDGGVGAALCIDWMVNPAEHEEVTHRWNAKAGNWQPPSASWWSPRPGDKFQSIIRWRWVTRPASEGPKGFTTTLGPGAIWTAAERGDSDRYAATAYKAAFGGVTHQPAVGTSVVAESTRPASEASEASEPKQEVQDEFEGDYHVSRLVGRWSSPSRWECDCARPPRIHGSVVPDCAVCGCDAPPQEASERKSTGLSREGVARERRESWRLGSREELIAKVEAEQRAHAATRDWMQGVPSASSDTPHAVRDGNGWRLPTWAEMVEELDGTAEANEDLRADAVNVAAYVAGCWREQRTGRLILEAKQGPDALAAAAKQWRESRD